MQSITTANSTPNAPQWIPTDTAPSNAGGVANSERPSAIVPPPSKCALNGGNSISSNKIEAPGPSRKYLGIDKSIQILGVFALQMAVRQGSDLPVYENVAGFVPAARGVQRRRQLHDPQRGLRRWRQPEASGWGISPTHFGDVTQLLLLTGKLELLDSIAQCVARYAKHPGSLAHVPVRPFQRAAESLSLDCGEASRVRRCGNAG